jgi:hypothetical protein
MGSGTYYTPTLENNLTGQGHTVSVVGSYTSGSLSAFDVYIQDGNSFFNSAALDSFVFNGGTLIEVPWGQTHNNMSANLEVMSNRTSLSYGQTNPGISVLDASNWLLQGVTLPGPAQHNIGREIGNSFLAGASQVLNWADGTAMLGYRTYGTGLVVSLNLHLITSDASPLNAAWSNQIVYNAINGPTAVEATPEPASMALLAMGGGLLAFGRKRLNRRRQTAELTS